ncbi:MAG: LamG domain-containing protein [Myxococcales bacterium]
MSWKQVWIGGLIAVGACAGSEGADENTGPEGTSLAALMEDGPLPAALKGSADMPEPPPRFCGNGGGFPGFPGGDGDFDVEPGTGISVGGSIQRPSSKLGALLAASDGGVPVPPKSDGGVMFPQPDAGPGGGEADAGSDNGSCEDDPIGFWRFDDCNTSRTDLQDSSNQSFTAFRSVDTTCNNSQEGLGAVFKAAEDLVYVPDQPAFSLRDGVTVAAWVKLDRVDKTSTIFRKRDDGNSAFALVVQDKKYQFIVKLASGKLVNVAVPAQAQRWTHVAATYDGTDLKLYIDGKQVKSKSAPGVLSRGAGPLLMGSDMNNRRLFGSMDNAWFNTMAAEPDTIMGLTCLRAAPTLSVVPQASNPVQPGTVVHYDLTIKNNNTATCAPTNFIAITNLPNELSAVSSSFVVSDPIASGQSASLPFDITSSDEAEPDTFTFDFSVFNGNFDQQGTVQAKYVVADRTGCFVRASRALTIRDVSVVDDPVRTNLNGPKDDPRTGAWSFGGLMQRLSPTPEDAPDLTDAMFRSFVANQTVNGFTIESRPAMLNTVLNPWPRTANGKLDLARAPLRLLAIVNRLDLKNLAVGKAGEGRMVFGMLDASGNTLEFTVILEYLLPADTEEEFSEWAHGFHALQSLPFPSEQYNAALQALTDRFTMRGALPGAPNDSALIDIRTNEIALSFQWQLREFRFSPAGFLQPFTVFQTPDQSLNFTPLLASFINENEASILAETHEAPLTFQGQAFATGSVFNNIDVWGADGINNNEARHKFSLNTCNGCHGGETQTSFLHVFPREVGQESQLSNFLLGETVFDQFTGEPRRLAELSRRRQLLETVVCPVE